MQFPFRKLGVCASFVCFAFVLSALMIFAPKAAWGQATSTGIITGVVTDNTNAVVPGATVTITEKGAGVVRTTTTNNEGHYVFVDVDPGTYDVKVTKQNFSSTVVSNQLVQIGTQLTENVKLQVGSVSTTVTVTETAGAELQTMNSTVGNTILHKELMNLPNINREATTMAILQPGTTMNGNTAGAVSDQNTFQLDGGVITDDMSGDNNTYIGSFASETAGGIGAFHSAGTNQAPSGVVPTPVTSIEEFKVGIANQTADFNQGAGSQIQMETKRGTSAFHGTVYEYYSDDNFGGANTWDNNSTGFKQASDHFSRFGTAMGGEIPKVHFLGGKWFIFGNYEGFRFPFSESFERNYPSASLRAGLIKFNASSVVLGAEEVVNLNNVPTVDPATGLSFAPNSGTLVSATGVKSLDACPSGACDPRALGMNPTVSSLWNTFLPLPNDASHGDPSFPKDKNGVPLNSIYNNAATTINFGGYKSNLALPQRSNFGVVRIDHDFSDKWHFNATYHYYRLDRSTANQVDVGGFFPGDTFGDYQSTSNRPQVPWFYTAGLTTNVTSNLTNDFHYSMTRNYWAYETNGGVPNVAGFPAALELGGETSGSFGPYNTDNQNTRTRFWDGRDNAFRDDLTWIKGNHLFQFGGLYERSWEQHQRTDNGGSIDIFEQYLVGLGNSTSLSSAGIDMGPSTPSGVTSTKKYGNLYSMVLGMVDESQTLFTRSNGALGLPLNQRNSCAISGIAATSGCIASPAALNTSIIPTYNTYFSDSWHVKPTLTLTYGVGYTIEMPPFSPNQAQDIAVDANGNILNTANYLALRESNALQGVAYNPPIGFDTISNVTNQPKYPYDAYYGGISPRLSAAWNLRPNMVVRGGWARVFGRLNGVDQVLVPILAPGLMQTVQCFAPQSPGSSNPGGCGNPGGANPSNVFRAGTDGVSAPLAAASPVLPQPWFPGINDVATGSGEALDPQFKPNRSDEFNISVQRQLTPKIQIEVGYIGRIIRNEYQSYDLNAVPYMMTVGGQSFANAWKNVMLATNAGLSNLSTVPVQPFFEAALGGPGSAYCSGFSSCTAAFVANEGGLSGNMNCACVFDAWNDVSTFGGVGAWTFGRSLTSDPIPGNPNGANGQATAIFENASNGYGNYNGGYASLSLFDWHGLTMKSNLTYSKALGTGAVVQATSEFTVVDPWNLQNMYGPQTYNEKYYFNMYMNYVVPFYKNQQGIVGKALGGWSIAPLFTAGSGFPVELNTGNGSCESYGEGNCNTESTFENGIFTTPVHYSHSRNSSGNIFADPTAAFNSARNPILGLDGDYGGGGPITGLPFWNLDVSMNKQLKFTERISSTFQFAFTNVFNHMQAADPFLFTGDQSTFGVLGGGFSGVGNLQANTPRRFQVGMTVDW